MHPTSVLLFGTYTVKMNVFVETEGKYLSDYSSYLGLCSLLLPDKAVYDKACISWIVFLNTCKSHCSSEHCSLVWVRQSWRSEHIYVISVEGVCAWRNRRKFIFIWIIILPVHKYDFQEYLESILLLLLLFVVVVAVLWFPSIYLSIYLSIFS